MERIHVLIEYIKQWSQKYDWNKYVTYTMKAYKTSIHERTKYTLHKLVFGRAARIPTNNILPDNKGNESYSDYATALFNRIFNAQASARQNIEYAIIRSKRHYDCKANPQVFSKDDYVYLLKESLKGKFDKQYKGSYKILEILENNNIKLAISDKRIRSVHNEKLKICKTRPTDLPYNPISPSRRCHLYYVIC